VEYHAGAVFVILANRGYAVMDRLAEKQGGPAPWPPVKHVDVAGLAESFGCPARRIVDHASLLDTFDEVLPALGERQEPLLLEIRVAPDPDFAP
jgi:benzoylformate decarboxylase